MGNKVSIYDLAYGYIKLFKLHHLSSAEKRQIAKAFSRALSNGWTTEAVISKLKREKQAGSSLNLDAAFPRLSEPKNLISPTTVYYHNELRITPGPVVVEYDYNTGELKRNVEDYFLEPRGSYSLDDLVAYFKTKSHLYVEAIMPDNRLKGSLKWIVEQHGVEMSLFMIDAADVAVSIGMSQPLKNPSNLSDFYLTAKHNYEKKMSECKLAGGDKVVPKQRKLS